MKKRMTMMMGLVLLSMAGLAVMPLLLQAQSDRGTADVTIAENKITIEYGRPSLNGRDMLGLLPAGRVWRLGMNQGTMLETAITLTFGEQNVAPGKYRLWARKDADDNWQLIINTKFGGHDPDNDVAVIDLKRTTAETPVETFTITLTTGEGTGGVFSMEWDTLILTGAFMVKK